MGDGPSSGQRHRHRFDRCSGTEADSVGGTDVEVGWIESLNVLGGRRAAMLIDLFTG